MMLRCSSFHVESAIQHISYCDYWGYRTKLCGGLKVTHARARARVFVRDFFRRIKVVYISTIYIIM